MSALLVAFWLPASSHSLLEYAGLIHERHADHGDHDDHHTDSPGSHEHNTSNHDAADGNCALSSTHVNVPVPNPVTTPFLVPGVDLGWASEFHVERRPSGLAPPGPAPPQLALGWQFYFRTALPARAPSLIS